MAYLNRKLADILATTHRPGDFYTAGTREIALPRLEVEGVGTVAFPLLPMQVEQLIKIAEPSPYGRGEQTLYDDQVRRSWQIDPDRVSLSGRHWDDTLKAIVATVANGLGVSGNVQAEFYKLLIYPEGSFFVDHRDTEKAPGMFATLIIVPPSDYSGGELLVRHRGHEARLALQCPDTSDVAFAAFYADCVHEVLPVTSGNRLALVYNLIRRGKEIPTPPDYQHQQAQLVELLTDWPHATTDVSDDAPPPPEKLVYLLEHAYTRAELSFAALKGADAAAAAVLASAAPQADCELHLALLSIEQSGAANYFGDWGRGRRRWSVPSDDNFEIVEVSDETATLSHATKPDGSPANWEKLPFFDTELSPPTDFDEMEPDEVQFEEASGNEGATFERFYSRAALVLWPRRRWLAVVNQQGLPDTLDYLQDLSAAWQSRAESTDSPLWQMSHELASHMIRTWPKHRVYYVSFSEKPSSAGRMLACLSRLDDVAHIEAFLGVMVEHGAYDGGDNPMLVDALGKLPLKQAIPWLKRFIDTYAEHSLKACANLLRLASVAPWLGKRQAQLKSIAQPLLKRLPGDPKRKTKPVHYPFGSGINASLVSDLLAALVRIAPELAMECAEYCLAWPEKYDLDALLLPATLNLYSQPALRNDPAVQFLREVCLAHLEARLAEKPTAPTDWARPAKLTCQCQDCQQLSQFLADPREQRWVFKAAEARRSHLASVARQSQSDVDMQTLRKGSPHQLVCTKNQGSYQRRLQQREVDIERQEQLR